MIAVGEKVVVCWENPRKPTMPNWSVSAVLQHQHHMPLPGMCQKTSFVVMWLIQLLPLQIQLLQLQINRHLKDTWTRDFHSLTNVGQLVGKDWQFVRHTIRCWSVTGSSMDVRGESVCSAASKRLSSATSGANASTYHGNGDTTTSLLVAQSRNPPDTPGVSSASVWCRINETDFCIPAEDIGSALQVCRLHRNLAARLTAKMFSPQQHLGSNCRGVMGKKVFNSLKVKAIYNGCVLGVCAWWNVLIVPYCKCCECMSRTRLTGSSIFLWCLRISLQLTPLQEFPPFELMFGCFPHVSELPPLAAFDTGTYQCQLRTKLAQLQDLVDASLTQAGARQKKAFDRNTHTRSWQPRDAVWLCIPTAGKLSSQWEGGWVILSQEGPTTYTITDGHRRKVVHISRLQRRIQPSTPEAKLIPVRMSPWQPPSVNHDEIPVGETTLQPRYPRRIRRPPDRLQIELSLRGDICNRLGMNHLTGLDSVCMLCLDSTWFCVYVLVRMMTYMFNTITSVPCHLFKVHLHVVVACVY